MSTCFVRTLLLLCALLMSATTATSHYLWLKIDSSASGDGVANVYFEESPAPRDGRYLDPFLEQGKCWIRTVANPEPDKLQLTETKAEGKRWLVADLPASAPRSVSCYGKWGVYRYGNSDILLHYYARTMQLDDHEDLHELARAEHMDLDIVLHEFDGMLEARVLWHGKPAADRPMYIRGPKKFRKNVKTDAKGYVRFEPEEPGVYLLRTFVELDESGMEGEKAYESIRHHATMAIDIPLTE